MDDVDEAIVNETEFFPGSIHHYMHISDSSGQHLGKALSPCSKFFVKLPHYNNLRWKEIVSILGTETLDCIDLQSIFEQLHGITSLNLLESAWYDLEKSVEGKRITAEFFTRTLPAMKAAAISTPQSFQQPFPKLPSRNSKQTMIFSVTLKRRDIFMLMSLSFFDLLPSERFSFKELLCSKSRKSSKGQEEKLKCFLNYFHQFVEEDVSQHHHIVTFYRQITKSKDIPEWKDSKANLPKMTILDTKIEESNAGSTLVDFANCAFGGGTFGHGTIQEEILLCQFPESSIGVLLYEDELERNEAAIVYGAKHMNATSGYGSSFSWKGCREGDKQNLNAALNRLDGSIVAIDAIDYSSSPALQYTPSAVNRELLKCYTGFKTTSKNPPSIASGKWGCGVFQGDPELKVLIQMLAAAVANRKLNFHLMGDIKLKQDLNKLICKLHDGAKSAGFVYKMLMKYCNIKTQKSFKSGIIKFIADELEQASS